MKLSRILLALFHAAPDAMEQLDKIYRENLPKEVRICRLHRKQAAEERYGSGEIRTKQAAVQYSDYEEYPACSEEGPMEDLLLLTDDATYASSALAKGIATLGILWPDDPADFRGLQYVMEKPEEADYEYLERVWRRYRGLPWEICKTERCLIRETTVADVDDFYRIYEDPTITEYMENLFADPEEERAYAQDYIRHVYSFYGFGMWTVCRKDTGEVIGRAGLSMREGMELPELGYIIAVPYQKQGYAMEVCRAILDVGYRELGFDGIQVLTKRENAPSVRLAEKLGFVYRDNVEVQKEKFSRFVKFSQN